MLKADIAIEKEVIKVYDDAAWETGDAGLKRLLRRIRDHEKYHVGCLSGSVEKRRRQMISSPLERALY